MVYKTVTLKGKVLNETLTKLFKFSNQPNRVLTPKIVLSKIPKKHLMIKLRILTGINCLMKNKLSYNL